MTRPSSVKIWRLGKLPDFGEGECDNFPSNTGQCELREHNPKKGKKEVYTVSNRVFFWFFVLDTVYQFFNTCQWQCFMDSVVAYVLLLLLKLTLELPTPGCCGESFCHLTATFVRKQRILGLFLLFEVGKQTESLGRVLSFTNNVLWKSFESLWVDEIFYGLIMTTMRGRMEGWSTKIDSIVRNILASPAFQRHIDSASETYNILQRTLVLTFLPKYHPSSLNLKMTQLRYC